jgi:acetyl-CoA carboxylase biotin carboxylase subunit
MVKASAGGGGRGMRVVAGPDALAPALASASAEAEKAFGDARIYLEKFIERPRHIEIQVLADFAKTVHLGERECSIQRRHQKLLEEAPSSAVSPQLRRDIGGAAIAAAAAVGYRGAGTCEFLLAADGSFYFLEMNTRIQVEHPVTEFAYGVDLVREQLRIAAGKPMTVSEWPMAPRGHSIECRIISEDPANGFLPSTGTIRYLRTPSGPEVRWDGGVEAGDEVTLHYDSLLGKLVVHAEDRPAAIRRMRRALSELVVVGVATNQAFHQRLLADPDFQRGEVDIQFLERREDLLIGRADPARAARIAVAVALAEEERRQRRKPAVSGAGENGAEWSRAGRLEGLR